MFNPIGVSAQFNSDLSMNFLRDYEQFRIDKVKSKRQNYVPSKSFSPSAFRCFRKSWFRLKGTQPDEIEHADVALKFTADIGTACHSVLQSYLSDMLGDNWLDVYSYIVNNIADENDVYVKQNGYETQVKFYKPYPISFSVDGLIQINSKPIIIEIKTVDYSAWQDMFEPRSDHIDQAKCYATMLKVNTVLFLYQERTYGGLKCFEYTVDESMMQEIYDCMEYIQNLVVNNIAPPKLPSGDKWCDPNRCEYYNKCKDW